MISIGKVGANHAAYYIGSNQEPDPGPVGYYAGRSGELTGRWSRAGGMNIAAGAPVHPGELRNLLSGRDPRTGEQLGRKYTPGGTFTDRLGILRQRQTCSAFDVTYSVPKSVSAAWAIAPPDVRKHIEEAFGKSAEAAIRYLQTHAVSSRTGAGGTNRINVPAGAAVARFDHWCSRAGDPQMHAHMLFANRVLCEDGKWRTLDGRGLYKHAAAASVYAAAVLRAEISQRLGWNWNPVDQTLHAEISGTPRRLTDHWSKRRAALNREAGRQVAVFEETRGREPTPAERVAIWEQAALKTRPPKPGQPQDPHRNWREEAAGLGVDPGLQNRIWRTAARTGPDRYDRPEHLLQPQTPQPSPGFLDHLLSLIEQEGNGLEDRDLDKHIYAALNAHRDLQDAHQTGPGGTRLIDLHHRKIRAEIEQRLIQHEGLWYSPGMIAAEHAALRWLTAPHQNPGLDRNGLDTAGLGEDQAAAARGILNADRRAVVIVGPAGAGKTTMLARAVAAAGTDNVIAAAPTATAAATLGAAIGAPSNTLAYLTEHQTGLPENGLIIVDEATQAPTRQLAQLAGLAARTNSRIVLVGDPAQQTSITLGGLYDALADHPQTPTHVLHELWRFTDREEAAATNLIRRGHPQALQHHHQHGRVRDGTHTAAVDHAARWWQNHHPHGPVIITAPTRQLTQEINREIAHQRRRNGQTGQPVLTRGETQIRTGDQTTTRRNNRKLVCAGGEWVKNGDQWTITGQTPGGGITAHRHGNPDRTIEFPPDYHPHLTLGYAITQTRAQSLTTHRALTLITAQTTRKQLYVGLTRGRDENHLYIVTDQPRHDPEDPPAHTPPEEIIQTALQRTGKWNLAIPPTPPPLPGAARHLQQIAQTPNNQPLPHLPGHPAQRLLAQAAQPDWTHIEEEIADHIDQWLHPDETIPDPEEDQQNRKREDDFINWILNNPSDTEAARRRTITHPHPHQPDPDYPEEYDYPQDYDHGQDPQEYDYDQDYEQDYSHHQDYDQDYEQDYSHHQDYEQDYRHHQDYDQDYRDYQDYGQTEPPPATNEPSTSTTTLSPAGAEEDGGEPPAGPDYGAGYDQDIRRIILRHLGADTARPQAIEHVKNNYPHHQDGPALFFPPQPPAGPGEYRNHSGPLPDLAHLYQQALHAGDSPAADRILPLLAAVADPQLRQTLQQTRPHQPPPPDQAYWAANVRTEIIRNRGRRHQPAIDQLTAHLENTLHVIAANYPEPLTETAKQAFADHHLALWEARLVCWLDNGADHPYDLIQLWDEQETAIVNTLTKDAPLPPRPPRPTGFLTAAPKPQLLQLPPELLLQLTPQPPAPAPQPEAQYPDGTQTARRLLADAAEHYHQLLLTHPRAEHARRYLQERGIPETDWKKWQLGYAPPEWDHLLKKYSTQTDAARQAGLTRLTKTGRAYDTLRDRITIPIHDQHGTVIAFAGRDLAGKPDTPKYLNTPTTQLYQKTSTLYGINHAQPRIRETRHAHIVEGYLDVIAAHRNGLTDTIATGGVAYTPQHHQQLQQHGTRRITALYDGDPAGQTNAQKIIDTARQHGTPAANAHLPPGQDPDSLPPQQLLRRIQQALPDPWTQIHHLRQTHTQNDTPRYRAAQQLTDQQQNVHPVLQAILAHQTAHHIWRNPITYHTLLKQLNLPKPPAPGPVDPQHAARHGTTNPHHNDHIRHTLQITQQHQQQTAAAQEATETPARQHAETPGRETEEPPAAERKQLQLTL